MKFQFCTLQALSAKVFGIDLDVDLIARAKKVYPASQYSNIEFLACDIMDPHSNAKVLQRIDLVTCFGLTMWIHLNHGDKGLENFLRKVCSVSKQYIIVEPQPWKCYRSAKRRLRREGFQHPPTFDSIQIRGTEEVENFICDILSSCNFKRVSTLGTTKWNRHIILFQKTT